MNFRDFLKSNLNEEKFVISNTEVFKLPTLIKGEQGLNASRNSLRRMHLDKQMLKKAKEVLKCIKTFCLKYIKGNERMLVFRHKRKNTNALTHLGLTYNKNDIQFIARYIVKYIRAEYFAVDYEEPNSNGKWFYEFIVKDFRQNSDFLKHFQDRLTSLNNIPGDDLYIKFSFIYCFDLNMLPNPYHNERQIKYVKRSNDSYIYVPCNQFVILDDVSFHF